MFKKFYPTIYSDSAYRVDFEKLYAAGYRGLVSDIDNTLVEHGAPHNEKADAFFVQLKKIGFRVCLISNNDEARVKPFADAVGVPYIFDAHKPSSSAYLGAMNLMGTTFDDTIFMGDQLFTDIFGANGAGMRSILVKPIKIDPHFYIRLKRAGERIVLPFYFRYAAKHDMWKEKIGGQRRNNGAKVRPGMAEAEAEKTK